MVSLEVIYSCHRSGVVQRATDTNNLTLLLTFLPWMATTAVATMCFIIAGTTGVERSNVLHWMASLLTAFGANGVLNVSIERLVLVCLRVARQPKSQSRQRMKGCTKRTRSENSISNKENITVKNET